jgi:hypothetical protein
MSFDPGAMSMIGRELAAFLELLQGFSKQGQQQSGVSDAEIAQWTERAAQPNFAEPDALPVCHE